jgi:uncharacterized protein (TIGR02271 family)
MGSPETVRVIGPGSLRGTIDTTTWPLDRSRDQVLVQFEGGTSLLVPLEALTQEDDGSYRLSLDALTVQRHAVVGEMSEAPLVLPVIEEALAVHTSAVETGRFRISKMVHEREEIIDPPLLRDEVVIERVPINRVVEAPIAARSEEDTLIIPLLEEVLVVEKRLLLKEELRITKRQVETHMPQRVTLRREEAIVEHIDREGDEHNPST